MDDAVVVSTYDRLVLSMSLCLGVFFWFFGRVSCLHFSLTFAFGVVVTRIPPTLLKEILWDTLDLWGTCNIGQMVDRKMPSLWNLKGLLPIPVGFVLFDELQ